MKVDNSYKGKRVRLIHMDDKYTNLKRGDEGTIKHVDDIGQIHVKWDNGSSLALIPGVDTYSIIDESEEKSKKLVESIIREGLTKKKIDSEIEKLKGKVSFDEESLRLNIEKFKNEPIESLEKKTRNIQHYGGNIHYAAKILLSLKK